MWNREVLYPFGYGLTYGRAEVISAAYDSESKKVSYEIVNHSDRAVEETVQVYKKNRTSKWEVRNTVLCGFAKYVWHLARPDRERSS